MYARGPLPGDAMSSITFDGFRSPWITPRACACASPASVWSTSDQMTEKGIFVVCIHSCTLRPGSASMTRYGEPSPSWPKSRARTMAGCSSDATARASWWNQKVSSARAPDFSSGMRRRFSATRSLFAMSRQR
jgi:hypothetical protein